MRSKNLEALVKLRLEGYTVVHARKGIKTCPSARWHVTLDSAHSWVFCSPCEAWGYLEEGKTYGWWTR